MLKTLTENPGKTAAVGGTGISVGILLTCFVTSTTFNKQCERCADTHRLAAELDNKIDRISMFLARQGFTLDGNPLTNAVTSVKTGP